MSSAMNLSRVVAVLFAALAGVAACEPSPEPVVAPQPTAPPAPPTASAPPPVSAMPNVDETALDTSANPCDDFYQYACGTWMKNTPIPPDEGTWTRSFDVLNERNENVLHDILEADAKGAGNGEPYAAELGNYYAACMDEGVLETKGLEPLKPILAKIDKLKSAKDLAALEAELDKMGAGVLFSFGSTQDSKDATEVIGGVEQAGLGLPDRDYYLNQDAKSKDLLAKYQAHVARMLALLGEKDKDAQKDAAAVVALETSLARASMSKVDQRDPKKTYNRVNRDGLEKMSPSFPWGEYFKALGAPDVKAITVGEPQYVRGLDVVMNASPSFECKAPTKPALKGGKTAAEPDKMLAGEAPTVACPNQPKKFPAADFKPYLRYHLATATARVLPKRFLDESFTLAQLIGGAEQLPPRWKRCVRATDGAMGEALAQPFVKKMLGEDGKQNARHMVQLIEEAMKQNLGTLAWMDPPTRAKAIEKLAAIANKIGYPDKWRSYDGLVVTKGDPFTNRANAIAFEVHRDLAKIGKPLDRNEWEMTPPTVNAYYEPHMNEMCFPAGILEPPFYAKSAAMGTNYGGIGMVIGHELTHGFDDEGSQFDGQGNLKNWWSETSGAEFAKRAECVAKQFDGYVAVGDEHVNGHLTLGEDIADLGGVKLAYEAFEKDKAATGARNAGKFTDEQQFFLGFAQAWCTNMRPELASTLAKVNPHAPPRFRVNGPLSNLKEFSDAFQCKPGQAMVRADRCEVW